jgi:DNA-binding transcriptional LysR family regulator
VDLRQLEILRAVAETGSFTAAGHHLHLSQSAVSRQILMLEDELEEQVFLRVGGKLRITPAGSALLALSRRVFEDIEATRAAIVDARQTLAGTIRLIGGMTVCLYVFPPLIKEFRRHHRNVEVKVTPASTPRLVRQLKTGAADLGLVTLPVDDAALEVAHAFEEELLLVMSPQHPLAHKKHVIPRDLARQAFVLFEAGSNSRRTIEEFFTRQQIAPKVVTETENVEIIKAMVRVNLGVSIVPYQAVAREVASGQLAAARIGGHTLRRETGWVHLMASRLPRAVVEMKRMLDVVAPRLKLWPEGGG